MRIDDESVLAKHDCGKLGKDLIWGFDRYSAVLADEMTMHLGRKVICRWPMTEVRVRNNPDALKFVKVPIDRREVDIRSASREIFRDLLCSKVPLCLDKTADQQSTGGGDTVSLGAKHVEYTFDASMGGGLLSVTGHRPSLGLATNYRVPLDSHCSAIARVRKWRAPGSSRGGSCASTSR